MSAYGDDLLIQIQNDLDGKGGIDSFGNYIDKPFMQGIIRILNDANIDPTILNWFTINLADLVLETNIVLPELVFTDEGDTITLSQYTGNTTGLLDIPNSINADLTPENNIIFGIDGWKPVTKINASALANKSFTEIELPNSLIEIGDAAFQNSSGFTSIFIPSTVTTIGANVFSGNDTNLIILSNLTEAPIGWDATWNTENYHVYWGVRSTPTVFEFDTKGGESISPIVARFLLELPTPTKFGYNSSGWMYNEAAVTLPLVPTGDDPFNYLIEVDEWEPWVYEARFILPDETIHETIYVTYGDTLGSEFILIDQNGANEPVIEDVVFRGWYTSSDGGIRLTSAYTINQDALSDGYIVNFYGQVAETLGLVFTYQAGDDVYDVTEFSLSDTSMADGSINLFVPGTYDDGTNGEKQVRHVTLECSDSTQRLKLGSLEIEGNSLTNRIYKNNTSTFVGQGGHFSNLTEVIIPTGFITINTAAFFSCSSLTSVAIPSTVITIENNAFQNCSSLTSITIPSGVTSIGGWAFSGCSSLTSITIPSTVDTIGRNAFQNCSSLTSITIPSGVTTIEIDIFSGCSSLTSVTIPSGVTSIGNNAFQNCSSLTSITIPSGVTSIGTRAFQNCSSLTSITIPSTVTSMSQDVFNSCSSLTSVTLERDNLTT